MTVVAVPRTQPPWAPHDTGPAAPTGSGTQASRLALVLDLGFVANLVLTAVLVLASAPAAARTPFLILALLTCPGYPCLRVAGLVTGLDTLPLTVALSLTITTLVATVEAITRWWHPEPTGLALAVIAIASLAAAHRLRPAPLTLPRPLDTASAPLHGDAPDRSRGPKTVPASVLRLPLAALAVAGVVLWALSVRHVNVAHLGPWGLLPRFPVIWYVGLALVVIGCVTAQRLGGRSHVALSGVFLAALVLYLYGTAPAIESTIRYAWTYKHLSVVQGVISAHGVHRTDIYQRWPGLFAAAAMFTTLSGHLSAGPYVRWGEPFFLVLDLVMLYPLARRFTSSRGAWFACYFFTATNWVGQNYFSPQAFGFVLTIACLLLATTLLDGTMSVRPQRILGSVLAIPAGLPARVRAAKLSPGETLVTWRLTIPTLAAVDAAIVVSHQLTPYILLFDIGALVVVGLLRPWWLLVVLVLLAGGFLAPNVAFIQHNFGLFSSLNPFKNAFKAPNGTGVRSTFIREQSDLSIALTGLTWLTAIAGLLVQRRRAATRRSVLVVAALFVAPFLTIVVQSYGGEARFRILLFSLPACAIAAAWLWERGRASGGVRRVLVSFALLPVPVALFVPNFFGHESVYYMPPGEVAAAAWVGAHGDGQVVVVVNTEFPGLQSDTGITVTGAGGFKGASAIAELLGSFRFAGDLKHQGKHPSNAAIARSVIDTGQSISQLGRAKPLILFATTEADYARDFGSYDGTTGYQAIEYAVAHSTLFTKLPVSNSDAAIYQVK